jgi:hypothetical protein
MVVRNKHHRFKIFTVAMHETNPTDPYCHSWSSIGGEADIEFIEGQVEIPFPDWSIM